MEWLYPNEGSTSGGDILTVAGTNLGALKRMKNVELRCRVDATETATSYLHDDLVTCITPPRGEGFVHVEFTVNGETVQSESRSRYPKADGYQYVAAGKVDSIFPVYGEVGGGAVIDIRGEDLKPSYRCRVGENAMGAYFISSTLAKCEAPAHYEDGVTVDVSNPNGVFNQFSDVEFQYAPKASVERVQPRMGNSQGGTVMTVSGRNFASTNALRCRVGTIESSGVWRGSHQVECVSPAMQPSPPNSRRGHPVQISSNQRDFTRSEVKFVYQEMSGVDAAFPTQLPAAGGAEVAIHLPLAHPMETPKCMFGSTESPGVLSADYVTCIAPSVSAGFHTVYVARNGKDYERLPVGASESNAVFV